MKESDTLADKMRELANYNTELPSDIKDELLSRAKEMEMAVITLDVRKMLGAWARARTLWCSLTGEPLV